MPPPAPSKHSPLPNPFFTGSNHGPRSPRSSISGKDSLGRIPSMSSLKSTVERMNSPARRMSSSLASIASGPVSSSENEKPQGLQLGKHYHSYDNLGSIAHEPNAVPSVKRRSPRKLSKISLQTSAEDLDALLAVQRTLFSLRTKISELSDLGDFFSAQHWLSFLLNDPVLSQHAHWSDFYRLFRLGLQQGQPAKLLLEAFKQYEDGSTGALKPHLTVLHAELLCRLQDWEALARLFEGIDFEQIGTSASSRSFPARNWDREQFPDRWLPSASNDSLRGRLYHFLGLAHRHLGRFELAIDAFDMATQHDPYLHASVAEMVYESRALIPLGQRQQYLDTLAISSTLRHSQALETQFSHGRFDLVLAVTRPHFSVTRNLASSDDQLLILHLGSLLGAKLSDELFALAHRLVELMPQKAVTWYAVGLYYEAVDRHDDSRRYLMKACSKEESFSPAWLMLGHSFSRSGDHDQAVSAYALLARHTAPASLPPRLFLAMEFLRTKQVQAANLYLLEAFHADRTNPWIMNEIAVMYSLQKAYPKAIAMLNSARTAWKRQAQILSNDLLITLLSNTVAIYLKFFATAQDLPLESGTAVTIVDELCRVASTSRLPPRTLCNCAAVLEVRAALCDELEMAGALYGRAADLFHQALLLSQHQDKMALLGYNRCLVLKVQNSAFSEPIMQEHEDMALDDDDDDDDGEEEEDGMSLPPPLSTTEPPRTPMKPAAQVEIESPSATEHPTASRPPTLRRRLTSLSFTDCDDEDEDQV